MSDDPLERARRRMADAVSEHDLISGAAEAHDVVAELIASRFGAATVAQSWSILVRAALAAAVRLVGTDLGVWYASGSVGRGDALPGSDLETLFVRADDSTADAALAHAAQVHELLGTCGIRGDDNGAVAARIRFNRTAREWADEIGFWASDPPADRGVVMLGLLADALPLTAGPDLRGQAGTAVRAHPSALAAMLQDATRVRAHVPSRLRTLTSGDNGVDIKLAAVDPVARIAQWVALSCGSDALSTRDRLRDGVGSPYLDSLDARGLDKCHAIGSSIRWRARAARWDATATGSRRSQFEDRVDLSVLSPQDRTALRSIDRELTGIRRKLDHLASTSTFSTW